MNILDFLAINFQHTYIIDTFSKLKEQMQLTFHCDHDPCAVSAASSQPYHITNLVDIIGQLPVLLILKFCQQLHSDVTSADVALLWGHQVMFDDAANGGRLFDDAYILLSFNCKYEDLIIFSYV